MTLSLSPIELQTITAELKEALLPLLATATESERSNMKLMKLEEVAENAGMVRKTVENWITIGKLRAVADWGSKDRPMHRVSVAAYWEFYDSNPVLIRKTQGRSGSRKNNASGEVRWSI